MLQAWIYVVKIVLQVFIVQKRSKLPTGIEHEYPDCWFGCYTSRL